MNFREVPLPDSSYSDTAKSFADQAVINRWAEYSLATGTRSPKKLADVPGLREFISIGAGPHRAGRVIDGKAFVVADSHFYQLHSATEVEQLGDVPGRSRCWITANKSQVLVSTGPDAWVFNLNDRSYTKITDPAFVGFISPDFINQMIVGIDRSRRFLYNSALEGQDDGALSYNDIERYESEGRPDRLRCSLVRGLEVLVFNEETTEIFGGTQGVDITNHILFRNKRIVIPHGCPSAHGACTVGGQVLFVGDDGNGYLLSGYDAVAITPPPIVQAWARHDLSKCFTMALETDGHLVWYVTFPDGETWGYDLVASRLTGRAIWHQRQSFGLNRWRLNTLFQWKPPGERTPSWFGGSFNSGMIYRLDDEYSLEGCDPLRRITRTGISHAQGNRRRTGAVRFEYNSGSVESVCADVAPFPALAGDVPNGEAGDAVDTAYVASGGTAPYGDITLVSGDALPPGLALDPDGTVSGTFTTPGSYAWSVQVTDASGLTAICHDTAVVGISEIAAALLLDIEHWWDFNGNLLDSEPNLPVPMGAYSALPVYQAGLNGQEAKTQSHLGALLNNDAVDADISYWFLINAVNAAGADRTQVALADAAVAGTPRQSVSIYNSGTEIRCYVDDASDADEPYVSKIITPNSRHFCVVNLNWAAKTCTFYVDDALVGTTVAVDSWWADMGAMIVRANNGNSETDSVDYLSHLGFMRRLATADERTYLYNGGTPKTYANLVTDGTVE